MINLSVLLIIDTQLSWKNQKKDKAKGATNQQAPVLEKEIKDCEKKKNDLTNRRVTRGGRGGGLPCPFLKIGKSALIFGKNILIVINYVLGPFFLVLYMIAYQSALISRKLPCSKNVVVMRLTHLVELLNGDFVKYSLTAADENDPKKIKEMLVKGRDLK